MRFLIQRVNEAAVTVEGESLGKIGKGLLVFVGISEADTGDADLRKGECREEKYSLAAYSMDIADKMVKKLIGLRIFKDENGKTNLSIEDVGGEMLIISQFTLYADCRRGNRPSFVKAGDPRKANELYRYIIEKCRQEIAVVEEGSFGANMKVSLVNDGPFTILLDSEDLASPRRMC